MAKRISKSSIDWRALEKLVPADQKAQFLAFKAKSDTYLRKANANPEKPPDIDWERYRKLCPIPGLVDKFHKEYSTMKVPYPEDKLTATVDAQWRELEPQIKKFTAEAQKEISKSEAELKRINALPRFEDMNMEMYKDLYPEEALDPVNNPSFWPHDEAEQLGKGGSMTFETMGHGHH